MTIEYVLGISVLLVGIGGYYDKYLSGFYSLLINLCLGFWNTQLDQRTN